MQMKMYSQATLELNLFCVTSELLCYYAGLGTITQMKCFHNFRLSNAEEFYLTTQLKRFPVVVVQPVGFPPALPANSNSKL